MGGEPTFVSIDNQVDPEWTTDADGPHKRRAGLGAGGPAEEGVGAAGPGAAQPGQVVSRENRCRAGRSGCTGAPTASRCGPTTRCWPTRGRPSREPIASADPDAGAGSVLGAVADGLGLPATQVRPAYEDRWAGWPARCGSPTGEPVAAARRPGGRRRRRAAPRCWRGSTSPSPSPRPMCCRCTAATTSSGWASADWRLRRGRIVLLEGDSPAGLRLPLDSISWQPPRAVASTPTRWPVAAALPADDRGRAARRGRGRRRRADHRAGRRGPRRAAVRLPAADRGARALRRPDQPRRGRRRQGRLPGGDRGLRPAAGSAAAVDESPPTRASSRSTWRRRPASPSSAQQLRDPVRGGPAGPAVHRVVRRRRHPRRHRRRQPHHPRRRHARRFAAAAPARPAGVAADLLAAPPVAVLPVLRPVHRHHLAGAAGRRGPRRGALRAGDRVRRDRAADPGGRHREAVGDRPRAAAPAHRHHRQHPPRRVLHRQAVQPRQRPRPARPAGAARLRDAAALPDGDGAVAAGALAGGAGSGTSRCGPR